MTDAPQVQRPATAYIYVIGAPCVQAVKIGRAADVEARLSGLQTGSPVPLAVLWQRRVAGAKRVEDALHKHFRDKRVRGEWFDLGPDAPRIVREACERLLRIPGSRRARSDAEGAEIVLSALREHGPVTAQVIAAKTGLSYMDVRVFLARLVKREQAAVIDRRSYALCEDRHGNQEISEEG